MQQIVIRMEYKSNFATRKPPSLSPLRLSPDKLHTALVALEYVSEKIKVSSCSIAYATPIRDVQTATTSFGLLRDPVMSIHAPINRSSLEAERRYVCVERGRQKKSLFSQRHISHVGTPKTPAAVSE